MMGQQTVVSWMIGWASLLVGCGATTSGPDAPADSSPDDDGPSRGGNASAGGNGGGGSASRGGSGGGGSASAAGMSGHDVGGSDNGEGGATVVESPLELGSCGIVRTLFLPRLPQYLGAAVTRQGRSFALGPWKLGEQASLLRALVVKEGGEWRAFEASGSTNDSSWRTLLVESDVALEAFVGPREGDGDPFNSRIWQNLDEGPRARGNVLSSVWRGSDTVALVPALDGNRALFAIWPHALAEPAAAVLGADGARLGPVHAFPAPDHVMTCPAVTPTAHGGFVSYVDSNRDLHIAELGGGGDRLREVVWPLPSGGLGCPSFALTDEGLAFLLDRAAYEQPADIGLYRWEGEDVAELRLPALPGAREVAMLEDDPLILRWSPEGAELSRPLRGELWPIRLPAGAPQRVASEPGNILLDFDTVEGGRTVVQLSCR